MRLAFGGWILDTDARQLLQGAAPVQLSPKAFDLLVCLVENRPSALSKDVLHDRSGPASSSPTQTWRVSSPRFDGRSATMRGRRASFERCSVLVTRLPAQSSPPRDSSATLKGSPYVATLKGPPDREGAGWRAERARSPRRRREHSGTRRERRSARLEQHLAPPRENHRRRRERLPRGSGKQERHVPQGAFD